MKKNYRAIVFAITCIAVGTASFYLQTPHGSHTLASVIFLAVELINSFHENDVSFSESRCRYDSPLIPWAQTFAEKQLLRYYPILEAAKIPEFYTEKDGSNICQAIRADKQVLFAEGNHPFVVRNATLFPDAYSQLFQHSKVLTPSWMKENIDGTTGIHAMDMKQVEDSVSHIVKCPGERKKFSKVVSLAQVLEHEQLYVNFNQFTLSNILETIRRKNHDHAINLRTIGSVLTSPCRGKDDDNVFQGYPGEMFFGWGPKQGERDKADGTSFHAALMKNFFFQVHGERDWVLVDPKYSQYMRVQANTGYINGWGLYDKGWLSGVMPEHFNRIPRLKVTTKPGDILFIPPWWWHEVRLESPGFSFGFSMRNTPQEGQRMIRRYLPFNGNTIRGSFSALSFDIINALKKDFLMQNTVQGLQHTYFGNSKDE